MPVMTYREALTEGYRQAMRADERVVILGEDVAGGAGASGERNIGGIFGPYPDFLPEFGEARMIDTPISESAIIGTAVGAALVGLRPVAEIMFADFLGLCLDQMWNQAAKFRYMFGGQTSCPVVFRVNMGAGMSAGSQHSQTGYPMVTNIPGLKVVVPASPADVRGLIPTAIDDPDPVIIFDHKALFTDKGEVPEGDHRIPFGEAELVLEGDDCTVVAIARMVKFSRKAAEALKADGISIDLINPRTLSPLDEETILESVEHTGRLVVVDESNPRCSAATDIAALVASKGFRSLKAPIELVTAPHTPPPFAPNLERAYVPSPKDIEAAVRKAVKGG